MNRTNNNYRVVGYGEVPSSPHRFTPSSGMILSPQRGIVHDGIVEVTMKTEFNVVIEKDEDGYFIASVPTLRGCHTQAKSLDVLMQRIQEAIELCLEV